jgi:hypothetical protein
MKRVRIVSAGPDWEPTEHPAADDADGADAKAAFHFG